MSQLVIEGLTVRVAPGSTFEVAPWGDMARAFSGRMRSDVAARHRVLQVQTAPLEADDSLALRLLLQSPGPLSCTGDLIGTDAADFHARGLRVRPLTATDQILSFELHETLDTSTAELLFSADGDAPGVYTFTRSGSVGTYRDEDGVLQNEGTADILRTTWADSDADGVVDAAELTLEPSRTNEFTQSEDLSHSDWTKSAASVTADQAAGPDRNTSLDEIIEDGTTAQHSVRQSVSGMTADASFAFSGFFRANTRTWVRLQVFESAAPSNLFQAWFNLSTGAVGTTSDGGTGTVARGDVEDWGNGLYRLFVAGTVGNGATAVSGIALLALSDGGGSYAGDGSSSIYGGFMQIEDSAEAASSYIATTTAAATREDETLYADFTVQPATIKAAGGATFYIRFLERGTLVEETSGRLFHVGAATVGADPRLTVFESNGKYSATYDDGSTLVSATLAAAPSIGDEVEVRVVLNSDGSVTIGQSIAEASETTASDATTANMIDDWSANRVYINSGGSTNRGLGHVRALKIAKGVKTMAEMRKIASARLHRRVA